MANECKKETENSQIWGKMPGAIWSLEPLFLVSEAGSSASAGAHSLSLCFTLF